MIDGYVFVRRFLNTNREVGFTVNIDAGEDDARRDVVSAMTVNPEGERSVLLIDCEGICRTAGWYAEQIVATMDKSPGGREACFHVCIDARTPGVHCSDVLSIQEAIRACGPSWITATIFQFHQGNLLCKAIFEIEEYATASSRAREVKVWIRDHHFAHGQYRKAGGKMLIMPAVTRALKDPLHCLNMVQNKGQILSVFTCDAFDLWVVKQGRSGKKGRKAVKEANRLKEFVDDHSFWVILNEAYQVSIPVIQLVRLGDTRMPSMGDTVACWLEATARVDEFVASSVAPPARVRKISSLVTDRKVACLGPLHFVGYALDPAHIDVQVFHDHKIMEGL